MSTARGDGKQRAGETRDGVVVLPAEMASAAKEGHNTGSLLPQKRQGGSVSRHGFEVRDQLLSWRQRRALDEAG